MTTSRAFVLASLLAAVTAATGAACSTPDPNDRVDAAGPGRDTFVDVSRALEHRCGSLDCHGTPYRNMRIYGYGGLRIDPAQSPEAPRAATVEEIDRNYESLIGLEPALMREVTQGKRDPQTLIVVRKARGEESHKGGARVTKGDDADVCLLTWLRGNVDAPACKRVPEQP